LRLICLIGLAFVVVHMIILSIDTSVCWFGHRQTAHMGHPYTLVRQEFLGRRHKLVHSIHWYFHQFSWSEFAKVSCLCFSFFRGAYFTSSSFCLPFAHSAFSVDCLKLVDALSYLMMKS
jgi:hypothetical protein